MRKDKLQYELVKLESDLISDAVHKASGCIAKAARQFDMNRTTLLARIKTLGLNHLIRVDERKAIRDSIRLRYEST